MGDLPETVNRPGHGDECDCVACQHNVTFVDVSDEADHHQFCSCWHCQDEIDAPYEAPREAAS